MSFCSFRSASLSAVLCSSVLNHSADALPDFLTTHLFNEFFQALRIGYVAENDACLTFVEGVPYPEQIQAIAVFDRSPSLIGTVFAIFKHITN